MIHEKKCTLVVISICESVSIWHVYLITVSNQIFAFISFNLLTSTERTHMHTHTHAFPPPSDPIIANSCYILMVIQFVGGCPRQLFLGGIEFRVLYHDNFLTRWTHLIIFSMLLNCISRQSLLFCFKFQHITYFGWSIYSRKCWAHEK